MSTFIALLRGINVGKAKRVAMARLRGLLEGLGYGRVRTLLNSGNVVFDAEVGSDASIAEAAAHHAAVIAAAIIDALGFEVPVIVLDADRWRRVVLGNVMSDSLVETEHSRVLVMFAQDAQSLVDLRVIEPLIVAPEQLLIGADAAYLWCAGGLLESKAAAALLGKLGRPFTSRNWATVLKLQALL